MSSGQRYQQLRTGQTPAYQGHDMDEGKDKDASPVEPTHRSWQATVLTQTFALLWIAPIMLLLVFNLNGYIIGASAWCPSRDCYPELFNVDRAYTQNLLKQYNDESHNLLGALQLVSKALEVWFEVIASFLVYLVVMEVASKPEGLGVGYIMVPFEYSRLPFVFDFLIYKIAPGLVGPKTKSARAYRRRIYLLLLLAFFLCGICNLMGPSTAVLVLPTLQWITTEKVGNSSFVEMNAAAPPAFSGWFFQYANSFTNCSQAEATAHNYSCTQEYYGAYFDSWIGSLTSTQQGAVSFGLNSTYQTNRSGSGPSQETKDSVYWSPNRRVASLLSNDLLAVEYIALGYNASDLEVLEIPEDQFDSYAAYNKSLDLYVQRMGPILGAIPNFWYSEDNSSSHWTVQVDANRRLRCYSSYVLGQIDGSASDDGDFTKCITVGSAWSSSDKAENFSIAGSYNYTSDSLSPALSVTIYSSSQAFFLPNGTVPSWMPSACFTNGTVPTGTNCDWTRLSQENQAISSAVNRTSTNVNTIEVQAQNDDPSSFAVLDFVVHSSFALYTLDCSPLSNPYYNIETEGIKDSNTTVAMDPAWILAAWSADAGGVLYPNRTSTLAMTSLMQNIKSGGGAEISLQLLEISLYTAAQALSLIDFNTQPSTVEDPHDEDHPFLYRDARINVYAYKISSRTAILGTIVAIIGIVVTLLEFVLALVFRRPFRSSTQVLISALSHAPREEFDQKEDEVQEGKVRFHVQDFSRERLVFRHTHV